MKNLPKELEEYIFDFIYYKKCYLDMQDSDNIKKCSSISKTFYNKFKCKPKYFMVKDNFVEYCLVHDLETIKNLKIVLNKVLLNLDNPYYYYYVSLNVNNKKSSFPLSLFNLEPYISIMEDDFFHHSIIYPKSDQFPEIKKINHFIEKIFVLLELNYSNIVFGLNFLELRRARNDLEKIVQGITF